MRLVWFLQPRITMQGTTNIKLFSTFWETVGVNRQTMPSLGICQDVWNTAAQSAKSLHRTIQTDTHACPKQEFQPLIVMRGRCRGVRTVDNRAECSWRVFIETLLFALANKKFPFLWNPNFITFCTKIKALGFCIERAENKTVPCNIFVCISHLYCVCYMAGLFESWYLYDTTWRARTETLIVE